MTGAVPLMLAPLESAREQPCRRALAGETPVFSGEARGFGLAWLKRVTESRCRSHGVRDVAKRCFETPAQSR